MIQTDTIISHIERLRDLQSDSPVSKHKAFVPSCWPKYHRADASARDQLRESGQEDLRALTSHFSVLLNREGISAEDVMSNFHDCKVFAKGRTAVSIRETFLNILKSAVCTIVTRQHIRSHTGPKLAAATNQMLIKYENVW